MPVPLPYSTPLFRAPSVFGVRQKLYTVPPNRRAVLKSITTVWGDIAVSGIDIWLEDDAGCKFYRVTFTLSELPSSAAGGYDLGFGSWVFLDGESIYFSSTLGTVDMQGSGYELQVPSP